MEKNYCENCPFSKKCSLYCLVNFCENCKDYRTCKIKGETCDNGIEIECNNGYEVEE